MRRLVLACGLAMTMASGSSWAGDFVVVASIKPVHALVGQVMTGVGTPVLLVGGAASPHTYTMKPSDAEIEANPRSRSAVLRVAAKLPE